MEMREIKFRMCDPATGKYFHINETMNCLTQQITGVYNHCKIHGNVFEQYTGLYDKNGKEIYEGDILKDKRTGDIGPVEWDDYEAGFMWMHPKMYHASMGNLEVIGNIHESKELVV
jgi:uncharacterized phage protein (TIGR01671 family)